MEQKEKKQRKYYVCTTIQNQCGFFKNVMHANDILMIIYLVCIWFHVASRDKELFKVVSSAVGSFDFSVRLFYWFCSEIVWRKGDPNREFICLLGIFSEETFWISHCWRVWIFFCITFSHAPVVITFILIVVDFFY